MIVIIGAGLTGLSAAYHLRQYGIDDIFICEKQPEPGGLLRTSRVDGFTFDHTGHFLHVNDPYFSSFLSSLCDLSEFDTIHRQSGVYTYGRINPYPFQMNLHGLPADVITECITGYINRPRIKKPRTFAQWVHTHFGRGIGKHFFFPFQHKILSYDLRKIEPSWTGRFVPKTNLAAMIKNAIEPPPPVQKVGYNSNLIYPRAGGIDTVIRKLVEKIELPIATDHEVVAVDPQQKLVSFSNGRTVRYTSLISTMPLNHLLTRTTSSARSTAPDQAHKLKCNSVLNINLGINRPLEHDLHWLYVPDPRMPFYRLGFWHNICPALAPAGHSALYAELSFMPGRDSKAIVAQKREQAVAGICNLLNIAPSDIILEHDLVLPHAYVIYDQWRKQNLSGLLRRLSDAHIHSIGRFGEWKYSSMQEAVLDGRTIADTLAAQYGTSPTDQLVPLSITKPLHERNA